MSTVDKMLIKGIRSYDPENKHVITFFKPLTLIVGPNGAGKTTIIECLKLSCTGELPPNARSGHSFVHDPKVRGDTETKGQIKLRFKTAAGKDVVCIRSFQLTQKASKMEYKAIESVLQTINPHSGEKVCLSYRCADMDREIPALMGVSKAILENVIFVHQDDANWPLQDPSTLKKKFDDIFSATRYTKALEVIKKLHKDQAQEIKAYKLKLENLQTLKDMAYKFRENIAEDEDKTKSLKSQIQDLERNIQKVDSRIQQTETTLKELRNLKEQIATRTATREALYKQKTERYASLAEENEDTDEELKEWQTKFEERIAQLQIRMGKLERETTDVEIESESLDKAIKNSSLDIGKLQHEAEVHKSSRNHRDSIIRKLFGKHNLGHAPTTPIGDDVALNLINRIKIKLRELEKDLQDKKKSNDAELAALWARFESANDRCSELEGQKHAKAEMKIGILKRIRDKENERDMAESELSTYNVEQIEEREKKLQIEVERRTLQLEEKNFARDIQHKSNEKNALDHKIKTLDREKDVIASDSEDRVILVLKKGELENHKKEHKKLMDKYRDKIRGALKGRLPSERDLKQDIYQAIGSLRKEYDDINSKSVKAEREAKHAEMKMQDVKNNLSTLQKDMDARKRVMETKVQSLIKRSFDVDSFPEVLREAMEKRDVVKSKYNMAGGMLQMFDPFENIARAHHFCPCCERTFSPEEEDEFVKKQRVKAASSAEHMNVLAVESSNADSVFQQLDRLRMVHEEYLKLGCETIPQTEKRLNELKEDLDQKNEALDDVVGVLAQVKSEKDAAEILVKPVEDADRLLKAIKNLEEIVIDLECKLDVGGKSVRSVEEIQSELSALRFSREVVEKELEKLREDEKHMREDLDAIKSRWHISREEKTKAANIYGMMKKAEEDLDILSKEKYQLDQDEKYLAEALIPLSKEKDNLRREHETLKAKLDQEYEEQADIRRNYQAEVDELSAVASKIKEYTDGRRGEKLEEMLEKLSLNESQLKRCSTRKQEISVELSNSNKLLQGQIELQRNIDDNLKYRETQADLEKVTQEIESLENKLLQVGDLATFETDYKKQLNEKERLRSELGSCQGTISVHQSSISKNKVALNQPQYNDIDNRYFNQLIQLKTTEMANKDLDRYYNALDKALMRFHSMKMEEINKIIRELWQQTYRGQDIDYIKIHSDSEGAGTRSYSYRVVMMTGDAELEMRGRCSAGQKVLASLIIRLALAETFCLHCGILALDEPTTNLDGPNAESLAGALLRIMEDRKGQENFQLIVITHDERFAQLIGQRQHAEKYYRISKDEYQHSIIEAQEIFD
ncbi:DNA repair protein rad50 [Ranunculus cassubicifolius]